MAPNINGETKVVEIRIWCTKFVAILKYLATKHKVPEHWYPRTNIQDQARVDEYMNWQHWNTRLKAAQLFRKLLIEPQENKKPVDWKQVEFWRKEVKQTVDNLSKVWLKDRPFLCRNEISVADIQGICELMQLYGVYEEKIYEDDAVVKDWTERVKELLQPHFDEAHAMTFRTRGVYPKIAEQLEKLKSS